MKFTKVMLSTAAILLLSSNVSADEAKKEESGGIGGFFGSLFKAPTPEEIIAKSEDKVMTKSFLDAKQENKKLSHISLSSRAIDSDRVIVPFSNAQTFYNVKNLLNNINSANDELATTYKKAVESRGNYYVVYNGKVNNAILTAINGRLATVNDSRDTFYYYDIENAIIEYSSDGTMVSALARVDKVNLNTMFKVSNINYANIEIQQVSRIFFASSLGIVSRTVSKRLLDDNMISTSKQETQSVKAQSSTDKTEQLKSLFELFKAGALTKEEFEQQKQKLLNQ